MIIPPNIRDDGLTGIDRSRKADVKTRDQCVIVITDGFEHRQARRTVGTQTVEYRYREADVVGQFRISMQCGRRSTGKAGPGRLVFRLHRLYQVYGQVSHEVEVTMQLNRQIRHLHVQIYCWSQ